MTTWIPLSIMFAGIACLLLIVFQCLSARKLGEPSGRMKEVSDSILEKARRFIRYEAISASVLCLLMAGIISLALVDQRGWMTALAYLAGAAVSFGAALLSLTIISVLGLRVASTGLCRQGAVCRFSFKVASQAGMLYGAVALLGLGACYIVFQNLLGFYNSSEMILGYSFGVSTVALFFRCGGGAFDQGTAIGARQLREEGTLPPEAAEGIDLAREAATRISRFGGGGLDLAESLVIGVMGPLLIASAGAVYGHFGMEGMLLPLGIAVVGMLVSFLSVLFVGAPGRRWSAWVFVLIPALLSAAGGFGVTCWIVGREQAGIFLPVVFGLVVAVVAVLNGEFFMRDRFLPRRLVTGGTVIGGGFPALTSLYSGMMATIIPVGALALATGCSYWYGERVLAGGGGLYAVSIMALGAVSFEAILYSLFSSCPVSSGAEAVLEISGSIPPGDLEEMPESEEAPSILSQRITGNLHALEGSYTWACASLAGLSVLITFLYYAGPMKAPFTDGYRLIVGLMLGALAPFVFTALSLFSVDRTARAFINAALPGDGADMGEEGPARGREDTGLVDDDAADAAPEEVGTPGDEEAPAALGREIARVAIISSVYEMVLPVSLALIAPLLIGSFLGVEALGGFLGSAFFTGIVLSSFMINSGNVWNGPKCSLEQREEPDAPGPCALVVGGTFTHSAAPVLTVLVKIMTVVSLLLLPMFLN